MRKWFFWGPLAILALAAFVAVGSYVVMLLWNWLTPALFAWHTITFWQALAILVLSRILFGRIGGGGGFGRPGWSKRWRERWKDYEEQMTPEERERMRQGMRERWGFHPPASEG